MIRAIRRYLKPSSVDAEMQAEMEFHRAARADDLQRQGLSRADAERQARIEFGSAAAYREEGRAAFGLRWADEVRADLRFAARGLVKSPGFTFAALSILALACGVNAAFFTLYDNYALRPLAIRGVERHVSLEGLNERSGPAFGWSPEERALLRQAGADGMEGIYGASGMLQVLVLAPAQRNAMVTAATANYFSLLAGPPAMGRTFLETEESLPVMVLSDAGWKRHFPGQAAPLGQTIRIRSVTYTVIGVMPPGFTGTGLAPPDFWVGAGMQRQLRDDLDDRTRLGGLLKEGVPAARAEAALSASARRLPRPEPVARIELTPHSTALGGEMSGAEWVGAALFAIFLSVLAIACANLANLFLARTAARAQEIRMRTLLGASRARIVRQLLTESSLIGVTGAAAGLGLGSAGVAAVHAWLFSTAAAAGVTVPEVTVDWRVFAYSAALGLAAGCAFGLMPAIDVTAIQRRRPGRLRGLMLSSQVAASLVLLILSALLVRNVSRIDAVDPGFDPRLVFDAGGGTPTPKLLARLRETPGVEEVSAVGALPLAGPMPAQTVRAGEVSATAGFNYVDDRYFETMGVRLSAGRGFQRAEAESGARVAVVGQRAAQRLWPDGVALGKTVTISTPRAEDSGAQGTYEVIGVAPDMVNGFLFQGQQEAMIYLPAAGSKTANVLLRFRGGPGASAIEAVRRACAGLEGSSGCEPKRLEDWAAMQRFPFRAAAAIAGGLGGLALLLTAIGLYSTVSYTVEQRKREIGVMVAIGARPAHVARRMLGEAALWVAVGIVAGAPVCMGLSWLAASTVLGIDTFDARAWVGAPVLLAAIVAAACLEPVRRALQGDPLAALKDG